MTRKRIHVGDRIVFTATTRTSRRKATRKVVGFDSYGRPMVGYHGWSNFIVGAFPGDKIHDVIRAPK